MGINRVMATIAALIVAAACDGPVAPTQVTTPTAGRPGPAPAAIGLVSGNDQHGKAGEQLVDPFVVRVTDEYGNGVSGISVSFQLASGAGNLGGRCDGAAPATVRSTPTNPDGVAAMAFLPTATGRSTVTAGVAALEQAVTFTTEASILVIEFWFGLWYVGFVAPCSNSSDVIAAIGTAVEWKIPIEDERYPVTYTVTSTSTPPGGKGFDSGMLTSKERFRFVPHVAGTWAYRDRVTGLTGTLTAR